MKKQILILGVVLAVVFTAAAFAKSDIGLKGVGGKFGYVKPEDIDGTFGFGAVADLGKLTPQINLEGELLYWGKSDKHEGFEVSYSQIYISALAKYFFPQKKGAKWLPYAGGGLGFVIGKAKVKSEFLGSDNSDSSTDLGIHLLGGMKTVLSPTMDGFAEVRYSIDGADFFGIFIGAIFKMK